MKGYTLIELLIVIAVMAILFSIGYLNFQDYSRQQSLLAVVRSIQTDLRTAQESAIAGNKPSSCNVVLNGYKFFVTSTTTYEIDAYCSVSDVQIKQVTLPVGITVTPPSANPIVFKTIAQGTNIPINSSTTISITQTATGNTKVITIGANGDVH